MVSASNAGISVGSWVARFHSQIDERPQLGLVRDAYDGNLSLDLHSSDGRCLGRHLAPASGPDSARNWEPIDPPDFQQLSAVFAYGKFIKRRRTVRAQLAYLHPHRLPAA